ncbi:hypothetical protein Scep_002421 [Stephania cephalantha]|uniref:Uncharacterized protein n=1 Tax=Stephania cephalantha TaxID=152367 RepID=A0AAP0Q4M1_9MAGN
MDTPPKLCTLEFERKMASNVVNFLSGRILDPTTTTTTMAVAATTVTDTLALT